MIIKDLFLNVTPAKIDVIDKFDQRICHRNFRKKKPSQCNTIYIPLQTKLKYSFYLLYLIFLN